MKKLLIFLVLALAPCLQAYETSISNGLAHTGTDGRAVVKVMGADYTGVTGTGMTVNCSNCSGLGTSNTAMAQGAPGTTPWPTDDTTTAAIITNVLNLLKGATSTAGALYVLSGGQQVATEGSLSALSNNQLTALGIQQGVTSGASAYYVNANGFNFLSMTAFTGVSPGADSVLSLTWAASTASGPIFADLGCTGMSGLNFVITGAAATPAGWVANSYAFGYEPCGQISQVPLEVNAANNPHLHIVGIGLSATSGTVGIVTKKRP